MVNLKTKDWKLKDIDLVIFDKDGTFIDIHKYWGKVVELRANAIMQYFSLDESYFEPLCNVMGYDINTKKLPPDSPVGLYSRNQVEEVLLCYLLKQNVDAYLEQIESIFQEVHQEFLEEQENYTKVIKSATKLMQDLKKHNVKMVVVTADSKENTEYTIAKNKLNKFFDFIFGAEDYKNSKTTGGIVKKIVAKTGIHFQNIICIGDTKDDYLMAKNSGIKACINVATGIVPTEEHKIYNRYCVNSLDEIELFD